MPTQTPFLIILFSKLRFRRSLSSFLSKPRFRRSLFSSNHHLLHASVLHLDDVNTLLELMANTAVDAIDASRNRSRNGIVLKHFDDISLTVVVEMPCTHHFVVVREHFGLFQTNRHGTILRNGELEAVEIVTRIEPSYCGAGAVWHIGRGSAVCLYFL